MREDFEREIERLVKQQNNQDFFGGRKQSVIEIVDTILKFAAEVRATDLHIEPLDNFLRFRYRIDGHLSELHSPLPKVLTDAIISRIKILAGMDTTAVFSPLDGAIHFEKIDMRVASMPSSGSETLTIRLMDSEKKFFGIEDLGFSENNEKIFRRMIRANQGMIILTGPMNSGKSTTLYAALRELNSPSRSIMTLEDPIEKRIDGISQIQVDEKNGLSFSTGLRTMLRMDCNCLMVGEARDSETAKIAVRAALTGHLLFTTLHSGESCSAVFRMLEMGVEPYLLAATLKGVIAQRLVRKLCPHCRELSDSDEFEKEILGAEKIYKPVGCPKCNGTGYLGRIALHEILHIDKDLRELILKSRDIDEIRQTALRNGLKNLLFDGMEKVHSGLTTLNELAIFSDESFFAEMFSEKERDLFLRIILS